MLLVKVIDRLYGGKHSIVVVLLAPKRGLVIFKNHKYLIFLRVFWQLSHYLLRLAPSRVDRHHRVNFAYFLPRQIADGFAALVWVQDCNLAVLSLLEPQLGILITIH